MTTERNARTKSATRMHFQIDTDYRYSLAEKEGAVPLKERILVGDLRR